MGGQSEHTARLDRERRRKQAIAAAENRPPLSPERAARVAALLRLSVDGGRR